MNLRPVTANVGDTPFSQPVGRFAPSDISGLVLWLDAADPSALFTTTGMGTPDSANNDPAGRWVDKSGAGRDFGTTQVAAPDLRMIYKTNSQNSLAGANGLGSVPIASLSRLPIIGPALSGASPISWTVVMNATNNGNDKYLMSGDVFSFALRVDATTGTVTVLRNSVTDMGHSNLGYDGAAVILTVDYDGTTLNWYKNGVLDKSSTPGTGACSGNITMLGDYVAVDNSAAFKGLMYEHVVYNRIPSATEYARLWRALNTKWRVF